MSPTPDSRVQFATAGTVSRRVGRVSRLVGDAVVKTFGSLMAAQVLGAGFGFLFWVFAARTVTPDGVAAAAAGIAAMMLIGGITNLGTGMLLMTELPTVREGERRRLIYQALLIVAGCSALVALGVALVSPAFSASFRHAFHDVVNVVLFVVGTVATATGLVVDRAVLGLRRPGSQVLRNLIAVTARFPILAVFAVLGASSTQALLTGWTAALVIAQCVQLRMLKLPKPADRFTWSRIRANIRRYYRAAITHHALNLSLGLAPQAMPILAAAVLVPAIFASFNMAWVISGFLFVVPYAMAITLLAVSATDGGDVPARIRVTVCAGLVLAGIGAMGALLLGGFVLHAFGPSYADQGTPLIHLLSVAALPLVIKDHFFMIQRLRGRRARAAGLAMGGVLLELTAAAIGAATAGASGLAIGWLLALLAEASAMLATVVRAMRVPGIRP